MRSLLAILAILSCGCSAGCSTGKTNDGGDGDADADGDSDSDSDPDGLCYDLDCDGFGLGRGCAGPDCDETDPQVNAGCGTDNCGGDGRGTDCPCDPDANPAPVSCWTGEAENEGVGVCRAGERECMAEGRWGPCSAQLPRCGGEECNYLDDDCDGEEDEGVRSPDETCDTGGGNCFGPDCEDPTDLCDEQAQLDDLECGPEGWLELGSTTTDHGFIWIANSAEDTVTKLRTDTGEEVGRFYTGDPSTDPDPSRTSVGSTGAVYVGNRARYRYDGGSVDPIPADGPTRAASVTKIAADEADCVDANGNGSIETSRDSVPLPWGDDECVLWTAPVGEAGCTLRGVAAGGEAALDEAFDEVVYAGCFSESRVYVLGGEDGELRDTIETPGVKPYGLALSSDRKLFISSLGENPFGGLVPLPAADGTNNVGILDLNVDPPTFTTTRPPACGELGGGGLVLPDALRVPGINTYGISADAEGRLWSCNFLFNCLYRYDPDADEWDFANEVPYCRGIAVDREGFVWTAEGVSNEPGSFVTKIDPDTMEVLGTVPTSGSVAVGVAVDFDGNVWAVNKMSDDVSKIDADDMEEVGVYPVGSVPYTYSDMTGVQLDNVLPIGRYRRTHRICLGEEESTRWISLTLDSEIPVGTSIAVRGRTNDDETLLGEEEWTGLAVVGQGDPQVVFLDRLLPGRFLQIEFELRGDAATGASPLLRGYTLEGDCIDVLR